MSSITIVTKIGFIFRDDTHMASMRIVQFSRSLTLFVQLRPIFFHSLDLGRPIRNEHPSPPPLSLSLSLQMIINQLKENIIQGWLWYVIVFPSGRLFFFSINSLTCLAFHWLLSVQLKATSSPELFKNIKNLFFAFLFQRNDVLGQGWAETWLSAFSGLYILARAVVQKYHEISFIYNYSHF